MSIRKTSKKLLKRAGLIPIAVGTLAVGGSILALYPQASSAQSNNTSHLSNNRSNYGYTGSYIYGSKTGGGSSNSAAITNLTLSASSIPLGKSLFLENCSSCHGTQAQGSSRAPNLQGLGAATVDFWVSTGRMPLADPAIQAVQKPSRFSRSQTLAIDAYVASLSSGGPLIPNVNLSLASESAGATLFSTNCAACHTITGAGDALASGVYAPSLSVATPTQIAEAIRTGPGNMPRFGPLTLSNQQVADLAKYVGYLQHPNDRGGIALGHVGPVTEGFVGILVGLGSIMLAGFWIGGKNK